MVKADYQLRYSKKAKRLQLRILREGLEVVVPARAKISSFIIEQFISQKEKWIEKNWDRVTFKSHIPTLPNQICLTAINETWQVSYIQTTNKKLELFVNLNQQITLIGDIQNTEKCLQKLRDWLIETAKPILAEQLNLLSKEYELPFYCVSIRNNSTRWGSCSNKKNISLCCKLLFLPQRLMRHILLHELCHTKIMRHGKTFWQLLERYDNAAREHALELRSAAKTIPDWV